MNDALPLGLCLVVCTYLEQEVRAALDAEGLSDVALASFDGECDQSANTDEILKRVPEGCLGEPQNLKVLGGACQRLQTADIAEASHVHPQSTCFDILLGPETTEELVREGCHILTPAMIQNWRAVAQGWGFTDQSAKSFFEESGSRLVLLDTGCGPSCETELQQFSDYTGLDIEILPITLDYTRLYLRQLHTDWKFNREAQQRAFANRRIADLSLADELIKGMVSELEEERIIDSVIELFSVLCAPLSVHYKAVVDGEEDSALSRYNVKEMSDAMKRRVDARDGPLQWIDQCDGFFICIGDDERTDGILSVEGIAVPGHAQDYLDLAKSVTPILSLAVNNARIHKRLTQIEPDLLRYQNELELMVEERTTELTQEIAEKQKAQAELQEVESMYEDLYNNAPDMFVSVDAKTAAILQCNDTLCKNLGYSKQELLGQPIFFVYHPDCLEDVKKAFHSFVTTGRVNNAELQLKCKDGQKIYVILNVSAVRDEHGNIVHSRSVWRDISDLKSTQNALETAKERAEIASKAKSEFLANMSHELRTPLNSIIGFSEMMEYEIKGPLPEDYREYTGLIHKSGTLLLETINSILDLAKIEAGEFELSKEDVFMGDIIGHDLELMNVQAQEKGLELINSTHDLHRLYVDPLRIKQVLMNVIGNAIKFTESGQIVIDSFCDADGHNIRVTDMGIGMTPEQIEIAFEPFRQVHGTSLARRHQGTGLGLSFSRQVMQMHGGDLIAESTPGKGTSMILHFPPDAGVDVKHAPD